MDPNSLCDAMSHADVPHMPLIFPHYFGALFRLRIITCGASPLKPRGQGDFIPWTNQCITDRFLVLCIEKEPGEDGHWWGLPAPQWHKEHSSRKAASFPAAKNTVRFSLIYNPLY